MNILTFALTALSVLIFSVWVNLNYTPDNPLFWPVLVGSIFVFATTFFLISKTFSFVFGLFR
nr:MAG: hypothetical protein [Caudoviricetes sp.]